ncbi:MAG: MBL fold metallo-hydrolase [Promethearchaeota archaeon]|nr:MAG: MBL fold metallo-hydrolase [Candidatus Lokiarchaeota archaeon]
MHFQKIEFDSIYFNIHLLSEGIYAAIFKQELGASSNAGIFDLGNISVIFDTLMDPWATKDLIRAVNTITNREPFLLINSHYHLDHVFGNHLFPKSMPIMSSPATLEQFGKAVLEAFNRLKTQAPNQIQTTKELLQKTTDPKKIKEYENDLLTYKEVQNSEFRLRPPDLLLHDKIVIHGSERSVEVMNVGNAHSYDDIIAYFPGKKICFMGDLLFATLDPEWAKGINGTPWARDPTNFKSIMEMYLKKDLKVYVPGHGPLCSTIEVKNTIDFLKKYFLSN